MTTSIFILQERAYADIDKAADEVRRRHITAIVGQDSVYRDKQQQAQDYVAAHQANPTNAVPGPYILAEATETSQSALVVANAIIARAFVFNVQMSPVIEARRVAYKGRVRQASTPEDIQAERDAAVEAMLILFINRTDLLPL